MSVRYIVGSYEVFMRDNLDAALNVVMNQSGQSSNISPAAFKERMEKYNNANGQLTFWNKYIIGTDKMQYGILAGKTDSVGVLAIIGDLIWNAGRKEYNLSLYKKWSYVFIGCPALDDSGKVTSISGL